jgi:hypothetical protein
MLRCSPKGASSASSTTGGADVLLPFFSPRRREFDTYTWSSDHFFIHENECLDYEVIVYFFQKFHQSPAHYKSSTNFFIQLIIFFGLD